MLKKFFFVVYGVWFMAWRMAWILIELCLTFDLIKHLDSLISCHGYDGIIVVEWSRLFSM
jgi:hypothetical protein